MVSSACRGDEAAGELGFEDDDREGVAEDIVEVAGDALALGDGGELYIFRLGAAEFGVGALGCATKTLLMPTTTAKKPVMR